MKSGGLLDLVYKDENMIRLIEINTGKIVHHIQKRGTTEAEYLDRQNKFIAKAEEISRTTSYPGVYVYYNSGSIDAFRIGKAEILQNGNCVANGYVEFTAGINTIGRSYYDVNTLRNLHPIYASGNDGGNRGTGGGSGTGGGRTGGGGGTGGGTGGGGGGGNTGGGGGDLPEEITVGSYSGCLGGFLGVVVSILLLIYRSHMYTIFHYANNIIVYASCPVMVVLFLLVCRIGKAPSGKRWTFWLVHLVLLTVGCIAVAYLNKCAYADRYTDVLPGVTDPTLLGLYHFLLCFAPVLVYGFVSGLWALLMMREPDSEEYYQMSLNSTTLMAIANSICIVCTQIVISHLPGMGIFMGIILPLFLGLLATLACGIALLPFGLFHIARNKLRWRHS